MYKKEKKYKHNELIIFYYLLILLKYARIKNYYEMD